MIYGEQIPFESIINNFIQKFSRVRNLSGCQQNSSTKNFFNYNIVLNRLDKWLINNFKINNINKKQIKCSDNKKLEKILMLENIDMAEKLQKLEKSNLFITVF